MSSKSKIAKPEIRPDQEKKDPIASKSGKAVNATTAEAADEQVEVAADSLEASIGYGSLLRELQHAYIERVAYYRSAEGGSLSSEEARAKAYHPSADPAEAERLYDHLMSLPVDLISFATLGELWALDPRAAQAVWEMLKLEASDEFETGHLASKALTPTRFMHEAWTVARYLGVRESLAEEWQPRGGIELSLIDMLAQAFLQYQYWVEQSALRTQTEPRQEPSEFTEWKNLRRAEHKAMGLGPGRWDIPYVHEQAAVEHAAQMAESMEPDLHADAKEPTRSASLPSTCDNQQPSASQHRIRGWSTSKSVCYLRD